MRSDPASSRENTISAAIGDKLGTASPQEILSGVRVLQLLHQNRDIDILVRKSYQRSRVPLLPHAVIEAILHSTRDLLDQAPEEAGPGLDVYLTELTAHIFENSAKPLVAHPSTTVDEYVALFTGDHLRWEAVGNLFAVASRALTATPANDTLFSGGSNRLPDRSTLILQMAEASDCCLILCARVSSANELLVALQVNDVMLKTQQYGDSSKKWDPISPLIKRRRELVKSELTRNLPYLRLPGMETARRPLRHRLLHRSSQAKRGRRQGCERLSRLSRAVETGLLCSRLLRGQVPRYLSGTAAAAQLPTLQAGSAAGPER